MRRKPTVGSHCLNWGSCCRCCHQPCSRTAQRKHHCCAPCSLHHRMTSAPCGLCLLSATHPALMAFAMTKTKKQVVAVVRAWSFASHCVGSQCCGCWRSSGSPGMKMACGCCSHVCCRGHSRGCCCDCHCCCGDGGCCDGCGGHCYCCCHQQNVRPGLSAGSLVCCCCLRHCSRTQA